jgi:hypothetical protein
MCDFPQPDLHVPFDKVGHIRPPDAVDERIVCARVFRSLIDARVFASDATQPPLDHERSVSDEEVSFEEKDGH